MHFFLAAVVVLPLVLPVQASAQVDDRAAVHQAALDYLTAVYEAKPELIERSVSPKLTKHGFVRQADGTYRHGRMTYAELLDVARTWNADGRRDQSIKEVVVGDVSDQTATAIVRAAWGYDHMQLAKIDGRWQILNIVWQTYPPKR